jgi:hypothetical protein
MLIRTRTGISVDGFIATPDGIPVSVVMPDFVPHESYGWPEFDEQIDAVVLGRAPALRFVTTRLSAPSSNGAPGSFSLGSLRVR